MFRVLLVAVVFAAEVSSTQCGSSSTAPSSGPTNNVQSIVVNAGPTGNALNEAFTSVTICVPGQSTCQTIDSILVDTGSSGLRVLASALTLSLPQQTDANGAPMAECAQFVDGFTWGPVQTADVKMAGEVAGGVPIQVIGASGFSAIPAACSSTGKPENTPDALGANGILGVGLFRQDCGLACTFTQANPGLYYSCPTAGCQVAAEPLAKQVQNPVWLFAADNNGVMIQLPSVPTGGAATVSGSMIFGIGTQSNNALGSAKVLTVDADGNITTIFGGKSYTNSYLDSGSNALLFLDSATTGLPVCPDTADFYCPATLQALSATQRGINGTSAAVSFNVGSLDQLNARFTASAEVAGPAPNVFDWGLPFFFGRTVFTAIELQPTPAGSGPYFAY